jgi:hypothetical protein
MIAHPLKARQSLGAQSTAEAAVPYIVTLGGGPAKDGGAIWRAPFTVCCPVAAFAACLSHRGAAANS